MAWGVEDRQVVERLTPNPNLIPSRLGLGRKGAHESRCLALHYDCLFPPCMRKPLDDRISKTVPEMFAINSMIVINVSSF